MYFKNLAFFFLKKKKKCLLIFEKFSWYQGKKILNEYFIFKSCWDKIIQDLLIRKKIIYSFFYFEIVYIQNHFFPSKHVIYIYIHARYIQFMIETLNLDNQKIYLNNHKIYKNISTVNRTRFPNLNSLLLKS